MKDVFLIFFAVFLFFSCNSSKSVFAQENGNSGKVWEKGSITATGKITEVNRDGDGQMIIMRNRNGLEYICVLAKKNLIEASAPYRDFDVGETITFRGELQKENQILVTEILESL